MKLACSPLLMRASCGARLLRISLAASGLDGRLSFSPVSSCVCKRQTSQMPAAISTALSHVHSQAEAPARSMAAFRCAGQRSDWRMIPCGTGCTPAGPTLHPTCLEKP